MGLGWDEWRECEKDISVGEHIGVRKKPNASETPRKIEEQPQLRLLAIELCSLIFLWDSKQ